MMFIEMELKEGKDIYVNPESIVFITKDEEDDGNSIIRLRDDKYIYVKGNAKDIAGFIAKKTLPPTYTDGLKTFSDCLFGR